MSCEHDISREREKFTIRNWIECDENCFLVKINRQRWDYVLECFGAFLTYWFPKGKENNLKVKPNININIHAAFNHSIQYRRIWYKHGASTFLKIITSSFESNSIIINREYRKTFGKNNSLWFILAKVYFNVLFSHSFRFRNVAVSKKDDEFNWKLMRVSSLHIKLMSWLTKYSALLMSVIPFKVISEWAIYIRNMAYTADKLCCGYWKVIVMPGVSNSKKNERLTKMKKCKKKTLYTAEKQSIVALWTRAT